MRANRKEHKRLKVHRALFFCSVLILAACRQSYEPPAIKAPNKYLVVEGVMNANAGERTTIKLSMTRNLLDTFITDPVTSAQVQIEARSGTGYQLQEQAGGTYISDPLTLNAGETYRLKIRANGDEYLSDYVPVKITPAIDSLNWRQNDDVTIYVSTHDPTNNARYYRWDFTETWQYRAEYETILGVQNGLIFYRDANTQVYNCWRYADATQIALGTSVKLSEDVINQAPVTQIPKGSPRLGVRYSILVRQYALTEDAHKYWEILKKNTQSLGTLFDAQPGQLRSNLYKTSDPDEPVIGFASASSVTEKRMFISNGELTNWTSLDPKPDCQLQFTPQDPNNYLIYKYPDTAYAPYYFVTGGGIALARKACLECTWHGGTNQKPSFW
ncbi:MAG TPA: DUF4249 domain-containing protein [Chitinophagaceae bacterium]|nr:DUF4249 domain-containing protein [Chitinophagaceae bacterium]